MSQAVNVTIEPGGSFRARAGQSLLDAALQNGVEIPHDCRSGHCGTCRCTVVDGAVSGGETEDGSAVLACQARITRDVVVAYDETPPVEAIAGRVRDVRLVSSDVVEVALELKRPMEILPGQYCQFRFAGFPARCFSPTAPVAGGRDSRLIHLHVQQVDGGRVSQALGRSIGPGHKVRVIGPYGSAFLRPGKAERLVLAANGTGFAPIWSIALAALSEMPDREIVVVAGARTRAAFYMASALKRLIAFPKTTIVPVVQRGVAEASMVRQGSPADFLPRLEPTDLVYAVGGPKMVQAIMTAARAAGATCYADPFEPAEPEGGAFSMSPLIAGASRAINRLIPAFGKQAA